MQSIFRYQGLIFLVSLIYIQCLKEEQSIDTTIQEFLRIGHNVLQNGRIIFKPVSIVGIDIFHRYLSFIKVIQQIPIDQIPVPQLQQDDANPTKLKYIANGDILMPIEEFKLLKAKR